MLNNLIPRFITREGGVKVNETPKIYCIQPNVDDNCIFSKGTNLCIALQLSGISSYFNTRNPLPSELSSQLSQAVTKPYLKIYTGITLTQMLLHIQPLRWRHLNLDLQLVVRQYYLTIVVYMFVNFLEVSQVKI